MATSHASEVLHRLRRAALLRDGAGMTDGQLLECFISRREDAAFAALLRRHGPMVWGVCRRVLHSHHDAEDAFQATFLVFVRKAASIVPRERVANWLYGVAHQTALKARATAARRSGRERQVTEMPEPAVAGPDPWRDLQPLLDQELSRLPDKYRVALVLCDVEGKTRKDAARQLGVPEGTLSGRLARGRAMLARRLARRGLLLSGGALAGLLWPNAASAGMPTAVASSTIQAATLLAAGHAAAGVISAKATALAEGVQQAMVLTKLKAISAVLLGAVVVLSLTGAVAFRAVGADQAGPEKGATPGLAAKGADRPNVPEKWEQLTAFDLGDPGASAFSLAVSPDGKQVAVGREGEVQLWDVASGREGATLPHAGTVWAVAFSPDGQALATGSKDGAAKLWDAATGRERKALDGHQDNVNAVAFSPDGKFLATGSFDKTIRLWDVATGKEHAVLKGHQAAITAVAFSPDGKALASAGGFAKTVKLWEVESGKELLTLEGHTDLVWCLAYSPDGKTLASGGRDKTVRLWDPATGKGRAVLKGHASQVNAVAFSPDGGTLASAGGTGDNTVRLWDVATGKERETLTEHTDTVWSVAFAREANILATGGNDGVVRVWKAEKQPKK
jgi:RNA polymerase sigma factor (sigma-70 family)